MIRYLLILLLCCSMAFADTVNEVVGASSDDTGALAGAPSATTSANLVLTNNPQAGKVVTATRHCAFRFTTISIAVGSTIDSIRLTFIAGANQGTNACNLRFVMEDTGDAATFSDTADYNARSLTTATADWNDVPDWTQGTTYTFPSSGAASTTLADVMQEVVDRADWASGNDMVFFLYDNSSANSANRTFASEDNTTYDPAEIDIWYTAPSGIPGYYHGVAGVAVRHSIAGNSVLHKK